MRILIAEDDAVLADGLTRSLGRLRGGRRSRRCRGPHGSVLRPEMQAELAMRQRDPLNIQHAMRQIVTSADRASHLINQLLALADTDTPPPLVALDLDALAREDSGVVLRARSAIAPPWKLSPTRASAVRSPA